MKKTGRSHASDQSMDPERDKCMSHEGASQASQDPSGTDHASPFPILGPVFEALRTLGWADPDIQQGAIEEVERILINTGVPETLREMMNHYTVPTYLVNFRRDMTAGIPGELTVHVTIRQKTP